MKTLTKAQVPNIGMRASAAPRALGKKYLVNLRILILVFDLRTATSSRLPQRP